MPAAIAVVTIAGSMTATAGAATHGSHSTKVHKSQAQKAKKTAKKVQIAQGAGAAAVAHAKPLGSTAASTPVDISVILKARHLSALESKVESGWSGHFLTTGQFAQTYGQSPAVISAIESYLRHFGLTTRVTADRLDIQVNGKAGQVDKALAVTLKNFRVKQPSVRPGHQATTRKIYASKRDPRLPAQVGQAVLAILGLTDYSPFATSVVPAQHLRHGLSAKAGSGIPEGDGLAPQDYLDRYNLTPVEKHGAQGQGRTIGIVTLASFKRSTPIQFWNKVLGLNVPAGRLKTIPIDGGAGAVSLQNGSEETDLDVEQSGAIAPKANVRVYVAPNTDPGFADAFFTAASDNIADTVSASWGEAETVITAAILSGQETRTYAQVFDEAFAEFGAQGQSNFVSAGDAGAYDDSDEIGTTNLDVDNPGDSPLVTSAGGTTLPGLQTYGVADAKGNLTGLESVNIPHEIAWGWDYLWPLWQALGEPSFAAAATDGDVDGGGGGGYSTIEARPSYQRNIGGFNDRRFLTSITPETVAPGLVEPTVFGFDPAPPLASGRTTSGRAEPDVSTNGDPQTGYAVYDPKLFSDSGGFAQFGGTSFVAPQLNSSTAVLDSALGRRVGFWNPQIYKFAVHKGTPFTPINDTAVYSGKNFLFSTDVNGKNAKALPGEFTNTNLFYTGQPGTTWNPATGLGTPNFVKLLTDFGAS